MVKKHGKHSGEKEARLFALTRGSLNETSSKFLLIYDVIPKVNIPAEWR
jgi:hypothetical protein